MLQYKLTREDLGGITLWISVWDWIFMGRNKFLGEIKLPLSSSNVDLFNSKSVKYALKVCNRNTRQ